MPGRPQPMLARSPITWMWEGIAAIAILVTGGVGVLVLLGPDASYPAHFGWSGQGRGSTTIP